MTPRQRRYLRARAGYRCEYCQIPENLNGGLLTVDHISPVAAGGSESLRNLALCCFWCNVFKGSQTTARDPETRQAVALFHPRRQLWQEHFRWSSDGTKILGLTPAGRATVNALKLNQNQRVAARRFWERRGIHPRHD